MRFYDYVGVNGAGRSVAGRLFAENAEVLEGRLRAMGCWLLEAKSGTVERGQSTVFPAVPAGRLRRELIQFATVMVSVLKGGLPMLGALELVRDAAEHAGFRTVVEEMRQHVRSGAQLSEAMARFPRVFPAHAVSLVRAGEQTGTLEDSLRELQKHLEWQDEMSSTIRQATIYPAIVVGIAGAFLVVLFAFFVPRFAEVFEAANVPLPGFTRAFIALGQAAEEQRWLLVTLGLAIPSGMALTRHLSRQGAVYAERLKLAVPLLGELCRMEATARFAHGLAVLYRSGITIPSSLQLCERMVGSPTLAQATQTARRRVETGYPLSRSMRGQPEFVPLLVRMVNLGEKTGTLDTALEHLAAYYRAVIPRRVRLALTFLEPILTCVMVLIVGGVAVSVFLPLCCLISAIR